MINKDYLNRHFQNAASLLDNVKNMINKDYLNTHFQNAASLLDIVINMNNKDYLNNISKMLHLYSTSR